MKKEVILISIALIWLIPFVVANDIDLTHEIPPLLDDKMLEKILTLSNNDYLLYAEHIVNKHTVKE